MLKTNLHFTLIQVKFFFTMAAGCEVSCGLAVMQSCNHAIMQS